MATQIKVPSIVCGACVRTITTAIQSQFPDAQIQADLEQQQLTISPDITRAKLESIILAAGHELTH